MQTDSTHAQRKEYRQLQPQYTKVAFSTRQSNILNLATLIRSCSSIYMCSVFQFQLFDYFVKTVIVRAPLISSIYSQGHAGGPFRKVFTDSFHSSRWEANMIWILIHPCTHTCVRVHVRTFVCISVQERDTPYLRIKTENSVIFQKMMLFFPEMAGEPNTSWPIFCKWPNQQWKFCLLHSSPTTAK